MARGETWQALCMPKPLAAMSCARVAGKIPAYMILNAILCNLPKRPNHDPVASHGTTVHKSINQHNCRMTKYKCKLPVHHILYVYIYIYYTVYYCMLFTTAHNHCLLLITSSRLPGWHGLFRRRPACLLHRQASEFECRLCWSSSAHATHQLFGWAGPTPTPPWHRWQSNEFWIQVNIQSFITKEQDTNSLRSTTWDATE